MSNITPVITVDTCDYGPVAVREPAWCDGRHEAGLHRCDLVHDGAESALTVATACGPVQILAAGLTQYPFATDPGDRLVAVTVLLDGAWYAYHDTASLDGLADALVARAAELRSLGRRMARLAAGPP